ncbi:fumarylacetoacetate hydrolase family protein [Halioglobus maricola]|uniref:fumarylacetoacetate hydrolase family protein n=1 Tax=Halioglobus maricola TaxID=2601894 RepID=UPI001F1165D6|nr:fumarylacetoacetate hydrolase family protein [Halioglobus maricola]
MAHIEELGNEIPDDMVVFMKPNSAIGSTLQSASDGEALHYEGEIALLVEGGKFSAAGFGLDLTKRALQGRLKQNGLPWERAKAFDGAALFSEFIPLESDLATLALTLTVDNELRQSGHCDLMMYPPATILEQLAKFTTLEDGDVVMTGTPAGVGPVQPGTSYTGTIASKGRTLVSHTWQAI